MNQVLKINGDMVQIGESKIRVTSRQELLSRLEACDILFNLYNETSGTGARILLSASNWLTGGSETQKMRLKGLSTPNYPSTVEDVF